MPDRASDCSPAVARIVLSAGDDPVAFRGLLNLPELGCRVADDLAWHDGAGSRRPTNAVERCQLAEVPAGTIRGHDLGRAVDTVARGFDRPRDDLVDQITHVTLGEQPLARLQ